MLCQSHPLIDKMAGRSLDNHNLLTYSHVPGLHVKLPRAHRILLTRRVGSSALHVRDVACFVPTCICLHWHIVGRKSYDVDSTIAGRFTRCDSVDPPAKLYLEHCALGALKPPRDPAGLPSFHSHPFHGCHLMCLSTTCTA